ncbi:hypothetical protein [Oceanobacillus sp. CF4.6]|uniref:hypothetical protein n=1 Tax=Oceanobacillus sp. CF4.6 TaxID=3373080 RepID=UPI003EE740FE
MLNLRKLQDKQLAVYGHFGRSNHHVSWERIDKVEELKQALSIYDFAGVGQS